MTGTGKITSLLNMNDVWVAVEPTGKECLWMGQNKFRVICCKDAFNVKSTCKFAFCPKCAMDVQEKLGQGHGGETGEQASLRSCKRLVQCQEQGKIIRKEARSMWKAHFEDLLTVDHELTSKSYLKSKR